MKFVPLRKFWGHILELHAKTKSSLISQQVEFFNKKSKKTYKFLVRFSCSFLVQFFFITVKRHLKTNKLLRTKRIIRSSRSLMFFKTDVVKNFLTCKWKHQCWSLFSINLQACNFIKNRLQHKYFPVNITKFLRTSPLAMLLSNHRQY